VFILIHLVVQTKNNVAMLILESMIESNLSMQCFFSLSPKLIDEYSVSVSHACPDFNSDFCWFFMNIANACWLH
jgi:hypothetical protein